MKTFKGGSHPPDCKHYTLKQNIEKYKIPEEIIIPIVQHIGKPANIIVKKGDKVELGQIIAEADGPISVPVHSSVNGEVIEISNYNHPTVGKCKGIKIKTNFEESQDFQYKKNNIENLTKEELIDKIFKAGISGLGGAGFPTYFKYKGGLNKTVEHFIINAVECEPFLTSDYSLMLDKADEIISGIEIISKILEPKEIFIGIEANKKDVFDLFISKLKDKPNIKPILLKLKYPQGGEKQLISAITGKEVPPLKLPLDIGAIVSNVTTVFAVYESVFFDKPLIEKIITVSGNAVKTPKNLLVRIGTSSKKILEYCNIDTDNTKKIILGGPMMGISHWTIEFPITKRVSGILCFDGKEEEYKNNLEEEPCIRCGSCIDVCALFLEPCEINRYAKKNDIEKLAELNIVDCCECGNCTYVCPSNIKILDRIRVYKSKILNWIRQNG